MSRRFNAPVDVLDVTSVDAATPGDGVGSAASAQAEPRTFRWRGRRYLVCAVLDSWQERRPWWREVAGDSIPDPQTERRVWRVEARTAAGSLGVFDLSRDHDSWLLLRAHD